MPANGDRRLTPNLATVPTTCGHGRCGGMRKARTIAWQHRRAAELWQAYEFRYAR